MTVIKYEGTAPCPPIQLFQLIRSIEEYPKFLSWCKEAKITHRSSNTIEASVLVRKYGFQFYCPVLYTLQSKNEIKVGLPSGGPFYHVSGIWRFEGDQDETKFHFELQLEHQNHWWLNFFIIPILKSEVKQVVKAFEYRASFIRKSSKDS